MYYYRRDEAHQLKSILDRYKDKTMKYSPEKEGEVLDIQVQPAGAKIAYYGQVEQAYLVIVMFKNHPGLVAPLFCAFNGIKFVEATHRSISKGEESQLITNKSKYGKWKFRDGFTTQVELNISPEEFSISGKINNVDFSKSFSIDGHWLNDYNYFFMDNPYYILNFADDNQLGLSKLITPNTINGKYEWQYKFERVIENKEIRRPGFASVS